MSQPNQPRCVVVVEPMSKAIEGMDSKAKENPKKKVAKEVEDKTNGNTLKKDAAPEATNTGKDTKKENSKENGSTAHLNGKGSKADKKGEKSDPPASSDKSSVKNGVSDVVLSTAVVNPTEKVDGANEQSTEASAPEEAQVQNAEPDNDDLFPELNYDDTSDNECNFDSSSPEFSPVGAMRSATRRSQAKTIPTPETPQQLNLSVTPDVDEVAKSSNTPGRGTPLREKIFKMKDMYSPMRVSPAPESGRRTRNSESPSVESEDGTESKNGSAGPGENGKTETNFSKSRVKVSPYRRSSRLSEQYSTLANYSGNNTTQQTELAGDISSSSREGSPVNGDGNASDSLQPEKTFSESYKHIQSRRSYKHLRELSLRNLSAQRKKHVNEKGIDDSISSVNATIDPQSSCDTISSDLTNSSKWTPIGHVIGRKRRQDDLQDEESSTSHLPAYASSPALILSGETDKPQPPSKRMRLLGYVTTPLGYVASPLKHLREKVASSTPILHKPTIKHWRREDPLIAPSSSGDITVGEEAIESPQVADIVPPIEGRTPPEGHKWCSIM